MASVEPVPPIQSSGAALGRANSVASMSLGLWLVGALWLCLLDAWCLYLIGLIVAFRGTTDDPSARAGEIAIALIALAILATLAWGAVLGQPRRWRTLIASAIIGTATLLFWYVVAVLATGDPGADDAAGAGLVFVSVPTLILVGGLLLAGSGITALVRRLLGRRARR